METVRLYFVGNNREYDSIIPLLYDKNLVPKPSKTYIVYGPFRTDFDLLTLYKSYGIDTSSFEVLYDLDFTKKFKRIYTLEPIKLKSKDHTEYLLSMVITKMIVLDELSHSLDTNFVLMQDCDILMSKPYFYFKNERPQVWGKGSFTESFVRTLLGKSLELNTTHEIYPMLVSEWKKLKEFIEVKHNKNYVDAMCDVVLSGNKDGMSEYHLYATWYSFNNLCDFIPFNDIAPKLNDIVHLKNYDFVRTNYSCLCENDEQVNSVLSRFI